MALQPVVAVILDLPNAVLEQRTDGEVGVQPVTGFQDERNRAGDAIAELVVPVGVAERQRVAEAHAEIEARLIEHRRR